MAQPIPDLQWSQPGHAPLSWGRRVLSLAPRECHPASAPVDAPTDAQITSLIAPARRLAQRRRDLHVGSIMAPDAAERLFRLDYAVRAGESVLAARAAESARAIPAPAMATATDPVWVIRL